MRVLVIGGAGFIGRHLVGRLVAQGHVVHVPTRQYKRGRELMVHPTVTVMQANVHDDATLDRLVTGCDVVVNLVGILHSRGGIPLAQTLSAPMCSCPSGLHKPAVAPTPRVSSTSARLARIRRAQVVICAQKRRVRQRLNKRTQTLSMRAIRSSGLRLFLGRRISS